MKDLNYYEKQMTAKDALLPESRFSVREIIYRLFFRIKLFIFCTIAIPIIAIAFSHMVPPAYKATSKIIIKYNNSVASFFDEITTSQKQVISGQSNVEIIRSLPICINVVKKLELKSSDMAKSPLKMIFSKFVAVYYNVQNMFEKKKNIQEQDTNQELTRIAGEFKDNIIPRVIEKGRYTTQLNDELIEVEVKSFNRTKIAQITNTLCDEFIDAFYRIYENEAEQAYDYLTKQLSATRKQIEKDKIQGRKASDNEWAERNINTNPIVERLARQVAELEKELYQLRSLYNNDSLEVEKARNALNAAVLRLEEYRTTESANAILNVLTEKRRTAYMTLQLYRNRLIPISIVEKAVTPKKPALSSLLRYGATGLVGLFIGVFTGFILVMFFSAIDNKLYTPWEIERNSSLEVIGSIRDSKSVIEKESDYSQSSIRNVVMGMLGMLDFLSGESCRVLLVTSSVAGEGKTTVAWQAANALARDKRAKTLLIDANFDHPDLTHKYKLKRAGTVDSEFTESEKGIVDVLKGDVSINDVIHTLDGLNLDIVFSGNYQMREQIGFYKKSLKSAFNELRDRYDVVIVDTSSLLSSMDASLFASQADSIILVIKAGMTRLEALKNALNLLNRMGKKPVGAVLNFRKYPVPKIFYG